MPIIVKKPFPFSIDDIKSDDVKNTTKDINIANSVEQVHPEFEEKPVLPSTSQSSEDTHGGSELTFSIPNQSSGQEQQQENGSTANNQNDQADQDTQGNTSAPNNNDNVTDNNGDNQDVQEQQNADGEKSNGNNETSDTNRQGNESGGDGSTNDTQSQSTVNDANDQSAQEQENAAESSGADQDSEDGNGNNDTDDQGQESGNEDNENSDAEGSNESENSSEGTNTGNNADGTSVTDSDNETEQGQENDGSNENGNGDTNDSNATDNDALNQEQENSDNEVEENDVDNEQNEDGGDNEESESEEDEQSQSGVYNTQQVVDVINAVSASSKYHQTEFWRFIEMIAEVETRAFDPMGSDEYNVKKLMFRQYERKPLSSYKMSRVKESVIIILDNSGSMMWWANNLQILADLAMMRNDVEVYLAPNGHIEEMIHPKHQLVDHDGVMKKLRNKRIIYVGDFDGADTPIILSWYNDVIWICPEERYIRFLEHNWVHYDETKYKGAFIRIFTLQELFDAFKKLLSTPSLRFWYDMCNKTHRCGGDEE